MTRKFISILANSKKGARSGEQFKQSERAGHAKNAAGHAKDEIPT